MTRMVYCKKLQREAPGLNTPPLPGEKGERIFENISQEAWELWMQHQTMLINEYRLSMLEEKSRNLILDEMEKFLFGEGSEPPPAFIPKD